MLAVSLNDGKTKKEIPAFVAKYGVSFPVRVGATADTHDKFRMGEGVPGEIRREELQERLAAAGRLWQSCGNREPYEVIGFDLPLVSQFDILTYTRQQVYRIQQGTEVMKQDQPDELRGDLSGHASLRPHLGYSRPAGQPPLQ